ncbi:spermidine/putrescine ABC transporter substrate-binding protein [Clostridium botulinum]|uniref:Spermidine/putrescine ABC transporter substrate-binding protein n=1 Tax=Clostridium botulinum C/D str. DC5 TaxID=1443128 RepID=A0A0A0IE22_CLOBO|nr:spermidine/putrescine ABC transporter substrate-binding protein [Clostridium botulinum]KEI06130.1 spermidine/putrescine ABC transporter substrate-binding protein [Clostridium botulinum C/D str. BKT75002]KEI08104.1 spermidine/putrescine ABC transporter substrate-binding protein [Clostridium botulinum C/D str. BKT2873]KGM94624.1 spermidine/putrescine ABC transporter substrate-binding protein [Clostridium botulinum D str. CCUG 7971]KGM99699.1 spermidine/putrescine ABC transporter substrate-bind
MKKIRKIILVFALLSVAMFSLTACGKDKNALNVYNWGDYIDESVIKQFEEEYHIKVNYETFATNEDMYVKLKKGGTNYDVVIPSDYMITKMINESMLEKIDMKNIPNFKDIPGKFKNLAFDPKNQYSVPYMWGTVGIIYNIKLIKDKIDSWDALWNPKYKDQILMVDSQRDAIAVALKKLGYSINTRNKTELKKAEQELMKQKPLVRAYVGDEVKDLMVDEEGAIAVVWSGDAVTMMKNNSNLRYVIPKEGSNLWFDNMVIPKGSTHKKQAELFINFMTRPDISLKNVDYIGYSTPNAKTMEMLDSETKNDKAAYPEYEKLKKCEVFIDLGDFIKDYDRAWTEIKVK